MTPQKIRAAHPKCGTCGHKVRRTDGPYVWARLRHFASHVGNWY